MTVDHPLKFLLYELPAYIEPAPLAALLERYELNKRAYYRQCKIRTAERMIAILTRRDEPREALKLAHWRSRLAKLQRGTL